jgi:hypothetical protein
MNKEKKALTGILLLGLVLRCIWIDRRGFQYDDAFSILLSRLNLADIVRGTAADTMPPLYYFLLHFWGLISQNAAWLRLLSVFLSLGSVLLLYLILKETIDPKAGLWAAFLAAISPLQIYHAQDLRMYALLVFFQMGYIYCAIRIDKIGLDTQIPWKWYAGLVFCGTAAMYSHNLAAFGLVIPNVYLLVKRQWRKQVRLISAQAVIGLLFAPWLWLLPGQLAKIQHAFWTPRPGLVEIVQVIIQFTTNLPLPEGWLVAAAVISLEVFVLLVFEVWRKQKSGSSLGFLILWSLVPPVLLFVVSYLMRPVFVARGFLVSSLAFFGLAGAVIAGGLKKPGGLLILAGMVAAAVMALPYQIPFSEFPRSPFQAAVDELKKNSPSVLVVHDNKLSYFPAVVYQADMHQVFLGDEPGSINDTLAPATQDALQLWPASNMESAVRGQQDFYFVVFKQTVQDYRNMGLPDHPVLTWCRDNFTQAGLTSYNDLDVYHFVRQ